MFYFQFHVLEYYYLCTPYLHARKSSVTIETPFVLIRQYPILPIILSYYSNSLTLAGGHCRERYLASVL